MKFLLRVVIIALAAFAVSAPAFAAENWPDSFGAYVGKVRKTVKTADLKAYLDAVKKPDGVLLIDVREPSEYASGHVAGTVNIPRGLLEFRIWKQLGYPKAVNMNTKIYTQCATGGRATLAAADLKKIGFKNVIAVVANTADFEKNGFPWTK